MGSAAFVVGAVGAGQVVQATDLGIVWMNPELLLAAVAGTTTRKCAGSARGATASKRPCLVCDTWLLTSDGAGGRWFSADHALHDGNASRCCWEEASGRAHRRELAGNSEGVLAGLSFSPWWVRRYWWPRPAGAGLSLPARGNGPLERHRFHHRLAAGDGARGTAAAMD